MENYASLDEMKASSDSVVVGTLGGFSVGRQIRGDAAEDVVTFINASILIDKTVAGRDLGESVSLEFLGPAIPDQAEEMVNQLNSTLPKGEAVLLFLRDKAGKEAGIFRVVNSTGLWAETSRSTLDTPMTFEPPSEESPYEDEIQGIDSLDEMIALVTNL